MFLEIDENVRYECQPEAILQRFCNNYVLSLEHARLIANAFKKKFGNIIVCREASYCQKQILTIIDCIINYDIIADSNNKMYLLIAFYDVDIYMASNYNMNELYDAYCFDIVYKSAALQDINCFKYNYNNLKKNNQTIKEELMEYLYSPKKIHKWILDNPDKDYNEYLN
jgi:hypothetical protein